MYGERTEQLILEVQNKIGCSREEVLAKVPSLYMTAASLSMEKPLGGFLKGLLKDAEAGNNSSSQEIMAQQMQKEFDKHPEYQAKISNFLTKPTLMEKLSQALGISSKPEELGYDAATGAFDANKAAAAFLGAKAPDQESVQALSEEVKAVVAGGEILSEPSDAAAGGNHS